VGRERIGEGKRPEIGYVKGKRWSRGGGHVLCRQKNGKCQVTKNVVGGKKKNTKKTKKDAYWG